jgi:hypothetical protein
MAKTDIVSFIRQQCHEKRHFGAKTLDWSPVARLEVAPILD